MRSIWAGCAIALVVTHSVLGQPVPPDTRWEQWLDEVPVSGGVRVGVMGNLTSDPVDPETFVVFVPETSLPALCVEVSSKDGRYEAKLKYDVSEQDPGLVFFQLGSKHSMKLREYAAHDLTIMAHLGQDCTASAEVFLVSVWKGDTVPDTVSVFVNSDVPTFIVGRKGGPIEYKYPCLSIKGGVAAKAYNRECHVPASVITLDVQFMVRKRIRAGTRIRIEDYDLPLRL